MQACLTPCIRETTCVDFSLRTLELLDGKKLPTMYFSNITGGEPFIRSDLMNKSGEDFVAEDLRRQNI